MVFGLWSYTAIYNKKGMYTVDGVYGAMYIIFCILSKRK